MEKSNNSLKIISFDALDSTNGYAFGLAEEGQDEIIIVRANSQTSGRGRRQNTWDSPANVGIYASFLLRPLNSLADLVWLPLFFSYASALTLAPMITTTIKWPNDILASGKKIGGVLVEAKSLGQRIEFAIAGIGLNVNSEKNDIPQQATSLYLETKEKYDIDELFEALVANIIDIYKEFNGGNIKWLLEKVSGFIPKGKDFNKFVEKYSKEDIGSVLILR